MKIFLAILCASIFYTNTCRADSSETRPLDLVYKEADVIFKGALIGAEIKSCRTTGLKGMAYTFRNIQALSGPISTGDLSVCGPVVPAIMSFQYIVAGNIYNKEITIASDSLVLISSGKEFYRLISNDSLQVSSDRGLAYAIAIEERDYLKRYGLSFGLDGSY